MELFSPSNTTCPFTPERPNRIALLGASGSIGTAALDVIAASGGALRADVLTVHRSTEKLVAQAQKFHPKTVVITALDADPAPLKDLPQGTEVLFGPEALEEVASRNSIDTVLAAIVGGAGLKSSLSAARAGKILALANKESLVVGGALLMRLIRDHRASLFPVDSEHSAIYQSLRSQAPYALSPLETGKSVRRLILTASGGPFRNHTAQQLENVTVEEALAHPTWKMGKKITIDSATMMNKAFEVIEACWLFDIAPDQITVMIHPQSLIHSMVEFQDSAVLAQISLPDMRLPIQLAFYTGERVAGPARTVDWSQLYEMTLIPADEERFPALALGREVALRRGTCGAVINAANEVAVDAFLKGKLPFHKIVAACRAMLDHHQYEAEPTLDQILKLDQQIRQETLKWIL